MDIKRNISVPRKGMQTQKHPTELSKEEYTFALNANTHSEHGDGMVILQNEGSNVKCSNFKAGFTVIGHKYDVDSDTTYFFLTNIETGISEIGSIKNIRNLSSEEHLEQECGCNVKVVLETPLEDTVQEGYCTYETIVTDACEVGGGCLNFDINYPIHPSNVIIKNEKTGKRLFFTDGLNPQRYLRLDDLEEYFIDRTCEEETATCLQCDKMRVFPLFDKPCLTPIVIQSGGNLRMGIYEVTIAYCDSLGNELTSYFSLTNPIHIFDPNKTYLNQSELDSPTNFSIQIDVEDLDTRFEYYKIAVIYRNGLDEAPLYKTIEINPTSTKSIIIATLSTAKSITLQELYNRRPYYSTAKGMAEGNGYLFQYGLETRREINLQPVVSLMGGFVKWITAAATEQLYLDGVNVSKYTGYMRDEVVPLAIKFYSLGGQELPVFPFVPRPPRASELDVLVVSGAPVTPNVNISSILEYDPSCVDTGRTKRWQYENTADSIEEATFCEGGPEGVEEIREVEFQCTVLEGEDTKVVDTVLSGTLTLDYAASLVDYIEENRVEILASTDPQWDDIKAVLNGTYALETCTPDSPDYCDTLVLDRVNIFPIGAETEVVEFTEYLFGDYDRVLQPSICSYTTGSRDTAFETAYMDTGEIVNEKLNPTNGSCATAATPSTYSGIAPVVSYHLKDKGQVDAFTNLITTKNATLSGTNFKDKLHSNAIWFEIPFGGRDKVIFEISRFSCVTVDDNTGTAIRISTYNTCASTALVGTSVIITDLENANDTNKFLTLTATDFPSGTAYIAIDSEMTTNTVGASTVYRLAPPCSCFAAFQRDLEFFAETSFTNLDFGKKMFYKSQCTFTLPDLSKLDSCGVVPYQTGLFSYWESIVKYPCNDELWDSSQLSIAPSDIPESIRTLFEGYYVDATVAGEYVLNAGTDFRDKPIRHYKFPCTRKVPHMSTTDSAPGNFKDATIFPIGFTIDNEVINTFLDIAVKNGLLDLEERQNITRYEIFRGDRRTERSIIAKGILFDHRKYSENNVGTSSPDVWYSNYPLNALGADKQNAVSSGYTSNINYSFYSPDTLFYKPTLAPELKLEGYLFGKAKVSFDEVHSHPKYTVLGQKAFTLASTLAGVELALEIYLQSGDWGMGAFSGVSTPAGIIAAALLVTGLIVSSAFKYGQYREQWIQTFRDRGRPEQLAYYQATVGHYNSFLPNSVTDSLYRSIPIKTYLKEGRWNVNTPVGQESLAVNNLDRESNVFLGMGKNSYAVNYPSTYYSYDNVDTNEANSSRTTYAGIGRQDNVQKNTAVPYATMKRYVPAQYGAINSVRWVSTNYCGDLLLSNTCQPIFGGDTFISRFAVKRKFPHFRTTAFGLANNTPFRYSDYFNINPPLVGIAPANPSNRYYLNYLIDDTNTVPIASIVFPTSKSKYNLDNYGSESGGPFSGDFYVKPPAKFYLYSYGFPYFLVESEYNCNYRYAGMQPEEDFYPNNEDVINMTQQENVTIRTPEKFLFNTVYKNQGTRSPYSTLPDIYQRKIYDRINNLKNSVIYSRKDSSETEISDPWLVYRPLDFYDFPSSFGDLVDMEGIESEQILARFKNGFSIFGSVDNIADRLTPETFTLGQGGIFAGRSVSFNDTELGYAGSQHVAKVSCNFGHFWADAKRGQVFQLEPGGAKGVKEISFDNDKWFKEQLPFRILSVNGITDVDVDNNYLNIGLTMGWDERFKRVFLTKLDYIPLSSNILFEDKKFYLVEGEVSTEIQLTDETYFKPCSWTIGYSPILEAWISFYSFTPSYYVGMNDYFQTGVNNSTGSSLWSHLPFIDSYQVFYGELKPFEVEYAAITELKTSVLHDINYYLDVKKHFNKNDEADVFGKGFNKAVVYNNDQNSGLLKLVHADNNNQAQQTRYPKYNSNDKEILQTEMHGRWSFNDFYNIVRSEKSGLPLWNYDCAKVTKTLNNKLLDYRPTLKDRLRGEYFKIRLIQDAESRFKMIFRLATEKRGFYE
jgi:hypothetical protein